jgi:hypothetical protein
MQYLSINIIGGLGNQLFQIFTTIACCMQQRIKFVLPYTLGTPTRPTYWDNFLIDLKQFTTINTEYNINIQDIFKFSPFIEPNFHYNAILLNNTSNQLLQGYFQSYKYFEQHYDDICKLFKLNEQQHINRVHYSEYFKNKCNISMHFRIGDYINKPNYHPVISYKYYENSIKTIINNMDKSIMKRVLVFYEKNDFNQVNTIIKLLLDKSFITNTFVEFVFINTDIPDWKQLLLMSNCDHNIIANSTFSWWGAYFNQNPNKAVCYPDIWFGPELSNNNTRDLCPDAWTKIECS